MARHTQQRRTRPILLLRPHLWKLRYPLRTFLPDILSHVHHAVSLLPSVVSQTPEMLPQAWRKLPQHHSRGQQQQYHRTVSSNDGRCHFRISCHRLFRRPARQSLSRKVKYLGQPGKIVDYLKRGGIEQVYCCLPSARSEEILPIIDYCENHLIRFFSVPNVCSYLKRRMYFELLGNVPVLCIRQEPLSFTENRFRKRTFDIVFSLLFLCTLFPVIYIIVGLTIKITSPGPIFFKQKRSGEDGREFWCYKFRSMKVNAQSDTLQATLHDPRKTRFGNFLRKSSIDNCRSSSTYCWATCR